MTENELRKMQDEALRRTREMQKRAEEARRSAQPQPAINVNSAEPSSERRNGGEAQPAVRRQAGQAQDALQHQPADASARAPRARQIHEAADTRPAPHEKQGSGNGALEFLFRDKEKTLILGLLLLLMDEKTDNSLLLALMYLLL